MKNHKEFITCHTVLVVKNVDNVFDYIPDGFVCLGQFLDFPTADTFRESIADSLNHGDRAIILSVYPEEEVAEIDVIVISDPKVN